MSQQQVHISGLGIICSIGQNASEVLSNLRASKTGIGSIDILATAHKERYPAGEIKLTNEQLQQQLGITDTKITTRTGLLGLFAARQAVESIGIKLPKQRTGFISATTVGGMDATELQYNPDGESDSYAYMNTHRCGESTEFIANKLGITAFQSTLSTACSSSANAIMLGARMIKHGLLDYAVVGGTDALSLFTVNGFGSLMILDPKWCRPFDKTRTGLNLGEGAAYLVLESEYARKKRNGKSLGIISGYANSNDAYHQTASSPEGKGATMAMRTALDVARLKPADISAINAHGTGTENNDASEHTAFSNIFGNAIPPFSSTKAFTGHTLAACGAIEAVIALLCIEHSFIPPSLNVNEPIDDVHPPVTKLTEGVALQHILSNSFGFGGNNSTLIISKS